MMSSQPPTEEFGGKPQRRSPWLIVAVVAGIVLILALAWAAFAGRQTPPEPTPAPTPLPTEAAAVSDPVCARIDATGQILVGTAADYPPFSSYDDDFHLYGFDIALMNAIAQELGVSATFKDYAFDGLANALQLGEIDAAIAAITITDERQGRIDFSDAYYTGVGAALARAGEAPSSVASPADFAGWRVGVGRGTVYESWAEQNLVAAGIVGPQSLFAYEKSSDAVRDLQQGRVDVVLLDEAAAVPYTADGAAAIVGEGGVPQAFAVAIPQDAACIQARINAALRTLAAAGVIDQLAQAYIGAAPPPLPTPTPGAPAATPTPVPPPVCIDSSEFVMDLTYDDEGGTAPPTVQPGEDFTKGWRIRNSGSCRWGPDYRLNYVGGNNSAAQMDGEPAYVEAPVEPGQTYDFYVDLEAPNGVYGVLQGRWQMQDPGGTYFGQTVWVMVEVVAPTPGPTRTATATTAATATVSATAVAPTPTSPSQATATASLPTLTPTTPPTPSPTAVPDPLLGQTFGFYAIGGEPTIPGTSLTLTFGNQGGVGGLTGSDGCNTFEGTYTIAPSSPSQGALTISIGAGTVVACPDDVATQAQAFRTALGQTTAYLYPPRGLLLDLLDSQGTELLSGQLQ
jgi:ABC-type amino acid transport substrate-binding protein/heat shock protein HslJ